MKILLIQHKGFLNGAGGTEKICCFLANNLVKKDFEVEIATNESILPKPMFFLEPKVKLTNIFNDSIVQKKIVELFNYKGKNPFLWIYYKVKKKYHKIYNKALLKKINGIDGLYKFNLAQRSKEWNKYINESNPDLIITMSIGSLLEITYKNECKKPILNSVNGRPDYDFTDLLWYRSNIEMKLLEESYKYLDGIQVLFESYKKFLPTTFNGIALTIPNPVLQINASEITNHSEIKEKYKIVNIASLNTSCKQQHIAISVFSKIANKYPNWDLEFWGIGNDLTLLEEQVKTLKLQNRVFFKGFTNEPIEKLKESDLFIFPSKYEGFPLALTEAMSVGLPSVGFKTCSGVNELIDHEKNGYLADNEGMMQMFIENLINDKGLRKEMGIMAHNKVEEYTEEAVFNKWLEFIEKFIKIEK